MTVPLLSQLANRFTLSKKQQYVILEMQKGVNMSVVGWPSGSAWSLCRGRRLPRLVGSLYCEAPLPPGSSYSLIMINILLEAIHYRLPP